jgi:hypothetical protein
LFFKLEAEDKRESAVLDDKEGGRIKSPYDSWM